MGVALIYIAFSFDPIIQSAARVSSSWWRNWGETMSHGQEQMEALRSRPRNAATPDSGSSEKDYR